MDVELSRPYSTDALVFSGVSCCCAPAPFLERFVKVWRPASSQLLQAENGMRMHAQLANACCFESFCDVCMQLDAMPAL